MKFQPRSLPHLIAVAGLIGAVTLTATGCASSSGRPCPTSPVPKGLAVAIGDRANSAQPQWPALLDPDLTKIIAATQNGANDGVTFVRVDGVPTIGCVMTLNTDAGNPTARKNNASLFTSAVEGEATRLPATNAQADPLEALDLASAAAGQGGTVVLIDSGLQTVRPLNFSAEDLLDADVSAVVAELVKAHELPDLTGRRVILDGIGYTAPPQSPLQPSQRARLVSLWTKIVRAAGATSVMVVNTPDTTAATRGLPKVSTVSVPLPGNVALGCNRESILPNSGNVGFIANTTTFRDEPAARRVLARVARWLVANRTAHAKIIGSIAHYGADDKSGLSLARAQRIVSVLAGFGVRTGQLSAAGMGWGPFPSKTAPPDPVADSLNRRVVVQLSCA